MSDTLEGFLLKGINKEKLEQLKKKADSGELGDLLKSVDKEKAEKLLTQMGLGERVKQLDIMKMIEIVKQNPSLLAELKKKL